MAHDHSKCITMGLRRRNWRRRTLETWILKYIWYIRISPSFCFHILFYLFRPAFLFVLHFFHFPSWFLSLTLSFLYLLLPFHISFLLTTSVVISSLHFFLSFFLSYICVPSWFPFHSWWFSTSAFVFLIYHFFLLYCVLPTSFFFFSPAWIDCVFSHFYCSPHLFHFSSLIFLSLTFLRPIIFSFSSFYLNLSLFISFSSCLLIPHFALLSLLSFSVLSLYFLLFLWTLSVLFLFFSCFLYSLGHSSSLWVSLPFFTFILHGK